MATIRGSRGELATGGFKDVASGAGSFLNEIKPHALIPTNAKELMLKDADYSTPQDHYFNYVHRNKNELDQGKSMSELNAELHQKEVDLIRDLYQDQAGRAESIEAHIAFLTEKRKPKTMLETFNELTDSEKAEIERSWGITLQELEKRARKRDEEIAREN